MAVLFFKTLVVKRRSLIFNSDKMKKIIGVIIVIKFTALLLQGNLAVIENSNQITLSDGDNTVLVHHKNGSGAATGY